MNIHKGRETESSQGSQGESVTAPHVPEIRSPTVDRTDQDETAGQPAVTRVERPGQSSSKKLMNPLQQVPGMSFDSLEPPTEGDPNHPPLVSSNLAKNPTLGQQSERFRSLPRWEQLMIIKLHKNLGHPSNDRLARALQVNGSLPEVVQSGVGN